MRILLLAVCLIINSCQPIHIKTQPYEYEGVPVVDSKGEEHYYTTTQQLDLETTTDYTVRNIIDGRLSQYVMFLLH